MLDTSKNFVRLLYALASVCAIAASAVPGEAQSRLPTSWERGLGFGLASGYSTDGSRRGEYGTAGESRYFVRIVNPHTAQQLHAYENALWDGNSYDKFAFSPDGKRFAVGTTSSFLAMYDADTGAELWHATDNLPNGYFTQDQWAFTKDGNYLVYLTPTASNSRNNTIVVRNAATGAVVGTYPGLWVVVSPTDMEMAVVYNDGGTDGGVLDFYNPASGALNDSWVFENAHPLGGIYGYTGDGSAVITSHFDGGTYPIYPIRRSDRLALGSTYIPYQQILKVQSYGNQILMLSEGNPNGVEHCDINRLDLSTGLVSPVIGLGSRGYTQSNVVTLSVAVDGSQATVYGNLNNGYGLAITFAPTTGSVLEENQGMGASPGALSVAPDGLRFVTTSGRRAYVWETLTGNLLQMFPLDAEQRTFVDGSVFWSPVGDRLFTTTYDSTNGYLAEFHDPSTFAVLGTLPAADRIVSAAFSPDGSHLITANGGVFKWWNVSSATLLTTLSTYGHIISAVGYSPTKAEVALSANGNWSLSTNSVPTLNQTNYGPNGSAYALAYSADGKRLAAVRAVGETDVFDLTATPFKTLWTRLTHTNDESQPIAFDPQNSSRLFQSYWDATDGNAYATIFDVSKQSILKRYDSEIGTLNHHLTNVAYTCDGQFIVYAKWDSTVGVAKNPLWSDPKLASVKVSPTSGPGGPTRTGTVSLDLPAPIQNTATVSLSSSNTSLATVPASVLVPCCSKSATFAVTTTGVAATQTVRITATYKNGSNVSVTKYVDITLTPPALKTLAVAPTSVTGGRSATGTVTLTGAAPADGILVTLGSSGPASVPASVTVPEGQSSATFPVQSNPVATDTSANIRANLNSVTLNATLTVKPPALSAMTLGASSVIGGTDVAGTVTLTGPTAVDTTINVTSANSAAHPVTPVVVPAGAASVTFAIHTDAVSASTAGAISAKLGSITKSVTLTVKPPTFVSLTLVPNPVAGGNSVLGTVQMSGPVAANTVVQLTNANTAARLPNGTNSDTVTILAGASAASFTMTTSPVSASTSGAVKATIGSVTKSVTLKVSP